MAAMIAPQPFRDKAKNNDKGKAILYLNHETASGRPTRAPFEFFEIMITARRKKERENNACCPFPRPFLQGAPIINNVDISILVPLEISGGKSRKRHKSIIMENRMFEKAHKTFAVGHSHAA